MKRLGYYAKDENNNLFQFRWEENDNFQILLNGIWTDKHFENYEVLEIGYFIAE